MPRFMFSALIPVVFSAAALALVLVLVLAGTSPQTGSGYNIISLNMSKIGSNIIKFSPATTTTTPTPTPLDPTGILGGILGGLTGITNDLTSAIDDDITEIEADIVTNITEALGVHDVYNIYLRNICELDYGNDNDPSSGTTTSQCLSYSGAANGLGNFTSGIPSYVVIGTTNVTVPLLSAAGDTFGYLQSLLSGATTVAFVLDIIGLVASGVVMALSLVAVILPRARRIILVIYIFALLAPLMLFTSVSIITVLAYLLANAVSGLGSALTISASVGQPALTVGWISWGMSSVSAVYWSLMWFVSYRRTSISRRIRAESEVGNWRGILAEVRRDLSLKNAKTDVRNADTEKSAFKTAESGNTRPAKAHVAPGQPDGETRSLLA